MRERYKALLFLLPALCAGIFAAAGAAGRQTVFSEIVFPTETTEGTQYAERFFDSESGMTEETESAAETEGVTGTETETESETEQRAAVVVTSYEDSGGLKDGSYSGSAQGYGGTITVKVTVEDGKIASIKVTEHSGETPSFYEKAEAILAKILSAQSPNVETISGATYSSNGIREAVKQALRKAGAADEDTESTKADASGEDTEKTEKKKDTKDSESTESTETTESTEDTESTESTQDTENSGIRDGVYTVTTTVYADENEDFMDYTLTADVTFQNGKLEKIDNLVLSDETNLGYCRSALAVIKQLISGSAGDEVEAVSGATCSSKAFVELYNAAYAQAKEAYEVSP